MFGGYLTGIFKQIIYSSLITLFFCGTALADGEKITGLIIKGNRRIEAAVILGAVMEYNRSFNNENAEKETPACALQKAQC